MVNVSADRYAARPVQLNLSNAGNGQSGVAVGDTPTLSPVIPRPRVDQWNASASAAILSQIRIAPVQVASREEQQIINLARGKGIQYGSQLKFQDLTQEEVEAITTRINSCLPEGQKIGAIGNQQEFSEAIKKFQTVYNQQSGYMLGNGNSPVADGKLGIKTLTALFCSKDEIARSKKQAYKPETEFAKFLYEITGDELSLHEILSREWADDDRFSSANEYRAYYKSQYDKTDYRAPQPLDQADILRGKNYVYYSQSDPRWGGIPFTISRNANQTIATSGCGPTAMSMVVSSLTGNASTPDQLAKLVIDEGFRTRNSGTAHGFFRTAASEYKLGYAEANDLRTIDHTLGSGGMAVLSMKPGHFTSAGHYIVVSGRTADGRYIVLDPNMRNSNYGRDGSIVRDPSRPGIVLVDPELLHTEMNSGWGFTKQA